MREARERAGLTQAVLARRVGTTQSAIARIEKGAEPSLTRLQTLLEGCGLSMRIHLAGFEDPSGTGAASDAWSSSPALEALARAGVPFVVTGRAAAAFLGVRNDVGAPLVVPDVSADAYERLSAALEGLAARRRIVDDDGAGTLPLDRSATSLRARRRWELATARGDLDIDVEPVGTRGYVDLVRRAIDHEAIAVSSPADTARHLDAAGDDLSLVTALRELAG